MAGFSFAGQVGSPGEDSLWARCVFLEDQDTGDPVAWVFLDLMGASLALHQAVMRALVHQGDQALSQRFVLTATHTHSAPGKFYGNGFYDRVAQPCPLAGFDRELTEGWARLIAECILEAREAARVADVWLLEGELYGVAHNRSLAAWRRNGIALSARPDLTEAERAINPTVTALVALVEGRHWATAAFYGCHATSLGPAHPTYSRDWPGVAVDHAEAVHGGMVAFGSGTTGDLSPCVRPPASAAEPDPRPLGQGAALRDAVGRGVGAAMIALIDFALGERRAQRSCGEPLPITLHSGLFEITERDQWPRWQLGVPALAGSEEGGPKFVKLKLISDLINEGFSSDGGPQAPKAAALGPLQGALFSLVGFDLAPVHPWHRIRFGDHLICTVPGEPTTAAGSFIATQAKQRLEVTSATVIGYSGDYAGYFTTPEEYAAQHYEGGSTLYGPSSLACLVDQLLGPDREIPSELAADQVPAPARSDVPQRGLDLLLAEAIEHPEGPRDRRFVFAVPRRAGPPPKAWLVSASDQPPERLAAHVRRFPHPDRAGSPDLSVFIAIVPPGPEGGTLELGDGTRRKIVPGAVAERRFSAPLGRGVRFAPRRTQPWFVASALLCALTFAVGLAWPGWLLELFGESSGGMREFALRMVALTPGLLAVEHFSARATPDGTAALGHARAGLLFWVGWLLLGWVNHPSALWLGWGLLGLVTTGGLLGEAHALRAGHIHPVRERWEFWPPLFLVSGVTGLVGAGFVIFAPQLVALMSDQDDEVAAGLVRLFGLGFLGNTLAMGASAACRDLRVVAGQVRGSLLFDAVAPVLFVLAVTSGELRPWTLLLALPFVAIVAWFLPLLRRAQGRLRWVVKEPKSTLELARTIREAASERRLVRLLGSGHSVDASIFADDPPAPPPRRLSEQVGTHVSLEHLDGLVAVDRSQRRISVQAGMHLGQGPNHPRSADANLLAHLASLDWSLPNLGGIDHQSVGGFLATGSAGGGLRHSLAEAVLEVRFVDGTGQLHVATPERTPDLFDAVLVSMGLLGTVVEVTFQCAPRYMMRGREVAGPVSETGSLSLPARRGVGTDRIDLTAPGELVEYLQESDSQRILWWPQRGIQQMVLWEAWRATRSEDELIDYPVPPWALQALGGLMLTWAGKSFGKGMERFVGRRFLPLLPVAIKQFIPKEPVGFYERWDRILPMDRRIDDYLLPTEFTEMWFPLDRTHEVMQILLDLYREPEVAGTFSCELYTAKASRAWLSPAYRQDAFRVDIFWFKHNRGDPVLDYFPQFWTALSHLSFRCHWGKYLPPPGSPQGAASVERAYPQLAEFRVLRSRLDPRGVFLTRYYRQHLNIEA